MRALFELGYHLIPCGGETGKQPLRKGWNRPELKRMPLATVVSVMEKANSCTYGIRLDGLAIVDCDTWDENTQKLVSDHFPGAQFQVRSSRGVHLYFRCGEPIPRNLKTGSVQIDFKAGANHFVVGPGSVRPDGRTYHMVSGHVQPIGDLVPFQLIRPLSTTPLAKSPGSASPVVLATQAFTSNRVTVGNRNKAAFRHACTLAREDTTLDALVNALALWAKIHCEEHETFSAAEIERICQSVWKRRAEGRLYGGKLSSFQFSRAAYELISKKAGSKAGNCLLLYGYLLSNHDHLPNRHFAVVAEAISKSGGLFLSKSTIDRCKRELCRLGLIKLLRKGRHIEPDLYVLTPVNQICAS